MDFFHFFHFASLPVFMETTFTEIESPLLHPKTYRVSIRVYFQCLYLVMLAKLKACLKNVPFLVIFVIFTASEFWECQEKYLNMPSSDKKRLLKTSSKFSCHQNVIS